MKQKDDITDLSESGVISVEDLIDSMIQANNYDRAEKWALNALGSRPGHLQLEVKLAEIYHHADRPEDFGRTIDRLLDGTRELTPEIRARLIELAKADRAKRR